MSTKNALLKGFHKHHIVPKHSGGTDSPNNLVYLHPIDHAILHKLRYRQLKHPGDAWAYNRIMSGVGEDKFSITGYKRTEETRNKLSKLKMGRKLTNETKQKLSEKKVGNTNATKKCMVNGIVFDKVGDAAKHFNLNVSSLSMWLSGKRKAKVECKYVE